MKKLLMLVMSMCLACTTVALAQGTMKSCDTGKAGMAKAPLMTLKGTVKAEGERDEGEDVETYEREAPIHVVGDRMLVFRAASAAFFHVIWI